MSVRRNWDALSSAYRRRLERGGISRSEYERGASLKAARGHTTTPENMREFQKNPKRFREYREGRRALVERVVRKKKAAFDATIRWNEENSRQFITKGAKYDGRPPTGQEKREKKPLFIKPPTIKQLQVIDAMTVDELVDFQYTNKDQDDWRFLWYH